TCEHWGRPFTAQSGLCNHTKRRAELGKCPPRARGYKKRGPYKKPKPKPKPPPSKGRLTKADVEHWT
ncbi:hypothetical protein LCGC14_2032860, partial [marine sediment metagenome]